MRDKIPDGSSIEELAQFWDAHNVTDYLDQLEEVTDPLFERRLEGISHLYEEEIDELVIAEADDDSAWEEPIKVKRVPERPDSRK